MKPQPPIPEPLWNTVPAEAQVAILAVLESLKGRIAELEQRVGDLKGRLKLNSTNSSKPPSSDPIGFKRKPPTRPSGRKRGGQPGHRRAQRGLVPAEKSTVTDCRPTDCRRCGGARPVMTRLLWSPGRRVAQDRTAGRRVPTSSPCLPQLRRNDVSALPEGVPSGCFGPYLQAVLATLASGYRLSKRQVQQMVGDLFGLSIATGMVSKLERQSTTALEAPYNEVALAVHDAEAAGIDDTSWRENRRKAQLWVVLTALTTVFTIAAKRSGAVVKAVLRRSRTRWLPATDTARWRRSIRRGDRSAGRTWSGISKP